MSPRPALLTLALLLAACGSSAPTDRASEEKVLVAALEGADGGSTFSQQQSWTFTGGNIAKGQKRMANSVASGSLKSGRAQFSYSLNSSRNFDMVIADGQLYVRPRRGTSWRSVSVDAASELYPSIRFDILRESITLGRSITQPVVTFSGSSVTRKYVVVPASDQLQQLQGVTVPGSGLTQYLKTASARVEIYLTTSGNQLARIVVNLAGLDPVDGVRTTVVSTVDFKLSRKVGTIKPPDDSVPVSPDHLLDPA
ncbi:MAG TPA: hypothetical protein VK131_05085 [Candidatus Acidoferrales bacterium]|nr:hypothetical protein [Candidatus Acidoferrales bacterium]